MDRPKIDNRPKTIFCDIDGTLVEHSTPFESANPNYKMILLPGVREQLYQWEIQGYHIVLTTGRRECARETTVKQLAEVGIVYDQLVMGITGGERVLINDSKPGLENVSDDGQIYRKTAKATTLLRNLGMEGLDI
jgi:hypothetical protein